MIRFIVWVDHLGMKLLGPIYRAWEWATGQPHSLNLARLLLVLSAAASIVREAQTPDIGAGVGITIQMLSLWVVMRWINIIEHTGLDWLEREDDSSTIPYEAAISIFWIVLVRAIFGLPWVPLALWTMFGDDPLQGLDSLMFVVGSYAITAKPRKKDRASLPDHLRRMFTEKVPAMNPVDI